MWIKDAPKEPGWYVTKWSRTDGRFDPELRRVVEDDLGYFRTGIAVLWWSADGITPTRITEPGEEGRG